MAAAMNKIRRGVKVGWTGVVIAEVLALLITIGLSYRFTRGLPVFTVPYQTHDFVIMVFGALVFQAVGLALYFCLVLYTVARRWHADNRR